MIFERLDQFRFKWRATAGRAERAVTLIAPRPSSDLREFGGSQPSKFAAVEFLVRSEGDMLDVEIEPHADCVGRHDVVDVAVLIEIDLRVSRARRKRAKNHRGAAVLTAEKLGDFVNVLRRKSDDSGTSRQARKLSFADVDKRGQARPGRKDRLGNKRSNHRLDRRSAEEERFDSPT